MTRAALTRWRDDLRVVRKPNRGIHHGKRPAHHTFAAIHLARSLIAEKNIGSVIRSGLKPETRERPRLKSRIKESETRFGVISQ